MRGFHFTHLNTHHHDQGDTVTPQSKQAKTPHTATGIFALLSGVFHLRGTGAQKISGQISRSFVDRAVRFRVCSAPNAACPRGNGSKPSSGNEEGGDLGSWIDARGFSDGANRADLAADADLEPTETKIVPSPRPRRNYRAVSTLATGLALAFVLGLPVAAQAAETPGTGWEVTSTVFPTNIAPNGGTGTLEIDVFNIGAAPSSGPITVTDTLPPGVVAVEAGDVQPGLPHSIGQEGQWDCVGNGGGPVEGATVVTCTNDPVNLQSLPIPEDAQREVEEGSGAIAHIGVAVRAQTGTPGTLMNHVSVSGGGGGVASTESAIVLDASPASTFGVQSVDGWASNADGTLDTQAGSHPYELFFSFNLNSRQEPSGNAGLVPAGGNTRNITVSLPPGLVGNPTAVPQCKREDFNQEACDPSTQVGVVVPSILGGAIVPGHPAVPVYNVVPPTGVPAAFGFVIFGEQVFLEAGVRSGGDYGITVHVKNVQLLNGNIHLLGGRVILWGEPADPGHDEDRTSKKWDNEKCNGPFQSATGGQAGCPSEAPDTPFLTLGGVCGGPLSTSLGATTWETGESAAGSFVSHDANDQEAGLAGCDHLRFGASISAQPDTSSADTPAGLTVEVHVPQEGLVAPGALATSDIKNTTVVLPSGVVINPGQAAGLQACEPGPGGDDLPLPGEDGEEERFDGPANCPDASKVGEDEILTPLLAEPLKGNVYVLQSNPPHLKLLLAASGEGVNLKLVGDTELCEAAGQVIEGKTCEAPGQLITTFSETPQLPFTNFKLSFSGGAQAALDTPTRCGTYTTTSDFTPWSEPSVPDVFPTSSFQIASGTNGGSCPGGMLPFGPELIAGATNPKGGAFTSFSLLLQRGDDQQRIDRLSFTAPEGLGGMLATVPLCGEPQAAQGTCSAVSRIGHATVASGPGPYPLVLPQPGDPEFPIYLTGPYDGAPFGLSIVTPIVAGPFNLGTIVTRAKIEINPVTAQVIVTTEPLPQILDGVPTDLRLIDSVIERPGFMFNPTRCAPSSFSGTASGTPPAGAGGAGETAPIGTSFDLVGCKGLAFEPKLAVTTSGKTSKAYGASLTFKFTNPSKPQGTDADFAKFKVDLPKQLPSRLTTLQKACTEAQFNANPAGCPAASVVGHMVVHTPELPVPVEGPMYFVSHGGEAFPELEIALQGDGVTVLLTGDTFISKAGITSSTFKTIPDVPFSSAEVVLPEGRYSALAANGNLCKPAKTVTVKKKVTVEVHGHKQKVTRKVTETKPETLSMPTEFVGQNGAVIHQSTAVAVSNCTKAKPAKKTKKKKKTRTAHDKGSK
jgi:uncharacterized repeat protein (TIGR01451 family)